MYARLGVVVLALCLTVAPRADGQPRGQSRNAEVHIAFVAAELVRFPKPLLLGAGKSAKQLEEALLVKVDVSRSQYDALPPDIEPYLYIGRQELRAFAVDRGRDEVVRLTFYAERWGGLEDGAPMVLTIEHGRPAREPRVYARRTGLPRFRKASVVDRR